MNEFDQFVKHKLKVKHYARYTDDFVMIANKKEYLQDILPSIQEFLNTRLKLTLHPHKIEIRSCYQGLDFLGYSVFPHHRVIRMRTKKRMLRKLRQRIEEYQRGLSGGESLHQSLQSYLGVLSHANAHKLSQYIKNQFWF